MDLGGAKCTLARQIRRQYVMGCRETNSELYNHLQKPDTQERPLKHLYKATIMHQTRKTTYGQWGYATTNMSAGITSSDQSPMLNVAQEPGAVIVDERAATCAALVGNYSRSGQFLSRHAPLRTKPITYESRN